MNIVFNKADRDTQSHVHSESDAHSAHTTGSVHNTTYHTLGLARPGGRRVSPCDGVGLTHSNLSRAPSLSRDSIGNVAASLLDWCNGKLRHGTSTANA